MSLAANERRLRERARVVTASAVKAGKLKRPAKCEWCGRRRAYLETHHPDYTKPLEVEWLCTKCHKRAHGLTPGGTMRNRRVRRFLTLTAEAASLAHLAERIATVPEIHRATGRTPDMIRAALFKLQDAGFVRQVPDDPARYGRPRMLWSLTARGTRLAGQQRQEMRRLLGIAEAS